jgi:hypothetical protein
MLRKTPSRVSLPECPELLNHYTYIPGSRIIEGFPVLHIPRNKAASSCLFKAHSKTLFLSSDYINPLVLHIKYYGTMFL